MKNKYNLKKLNVTKLTRRGISLITLVITIIVIIILAAAIILTLNNNNPIMEANKARYDSDVANMQAIFTNAVAKVMAQNASGISIIAGQINTVTSGVNQTTGEITYVLDNAMDEDNTNGKIIFNKGNSNSNTYFTGSLLPIYSAGKTKWYVDSEGNISLEVAGTIYGEKNIEPEKEQLQAGLYDENDNLIADWDTLVNVHGMNIEKDYAQSGTDYYWTSQSSGVYILKEKSEELSRGRKLIIDDSVTHIGDFMFYNCPNLTYVELPEKLKSIGTLAFFKCGLTSLEIPNGVETIEYQSFCLCEKITTVTIPSSVTLIGEDIFRNCTSLASVYFEHTTAPTFNRACFGKTSGDICTFYFKNSMVSDALIEGTHYAPAYGVKSDNYEW